MKRRLWLLVLPLAWSGCVAPGSATRSVAGNPGAADVPPASAAERLALPATDAGVPGAGPLRRADWFRPIWNERRALFARTAEQDRGAVVFLGDSITQGWGGDLGGAFAELRIANRGISGDTTRGVLYRLEEDVLALKPRAVVLLIGTNDLEEKATPDVIVGNVKLILDAFVRQNPRMPVVLCEVFPSSPTKSRPPEAIRALNAAYARLAAGYPQITLVPTWNVFADAEGNAKAEEFPDLLHPNAAGYAKWATALQPVLARVLK